MKVVNQKPLLIKAESGQKITLDILKVITFDQNEEPEFLISLNVEDVNDFVGVFFTLEQVGKFIRQLETAKRIALNIVRQ